MIFKFQTRLAGEHVHARLYIGPDEEHLAHSGVLIMRKDEWLSFLALARQDSLSDDILIEDGYIIHDSR